jgi:bifunctional DNA-binding transcriptional regulator/antitoxin component of YhaV-PrlF toxin-antitoxin module
MQEVKVTLDPSGKLDIPADYRQMLGIQSGDEMILRLEEGSLRLITIPHSPLKKAQAIVRQYVPAQRSLATELIQERRQEP